MSTQDIKQSTFDFIVGILKTQYALPAILVWLAWQWLKLTPDEVARMKELEPFLNSSLGIALAFVIVIAAFLIAFSYVFSIFRSFKAELKEDLKETFSEPMHEMAHRVGEIGTKIDVVEKTFENHIERGEKQRIEMTVLLQKQQEFFEAR